MRPTFAIILVAAAALLAVPAAEPEPKPLPGDEQDLVFLHDARPYLLRLHVEVDGRPLPERWDRYLAELFRFLDRDGDGSLDARELELAPSLTQLQQQVAGVATVEPSAAPDFAELDVAPRDGKVSPAELAAYYRRSAVGPLQMEFSWRQADTDPLSETLFRLLDRDDDGKLSKEELSAESIFHFDRDDNELVTVAELSPLFPGAGMAVHEPTPEAVLPAAARFVPSHPRDPAGPLVKRMLDRYDRGKKGSLGPKDIGLPEGEFRAPDADGDGRLSAAELEVWPRRPPDLELLLHLGNEVGREGVRVLGGAARESAAVPETGALVAFLGASRVELLPRLGRPADAEASRRAAEAMFSRADGNDDGFLDTHEVFRDPFEFVGLLRLADRDGDNKLSKKEVTDYLDLHGKLLACSTFLTLSARGRSLFELLDADHDGRINLREAVTAWERLKRFDADGDGKVSPEELPPQFLLTLSHGQTRPADEQADPLGYGRALLSGGRRRGPLWFRKMDRNGDGTVSRREFLGPTEEFNRLDRDGDGFLTVEEAEQAAANPRPK